MSVTLTANVRWSKNGPEFYCEDCGSQLIENPSNRGQLIHPSMGWRYSFIHRFQSQIQCYHIGEIYLHPWSQVELRRVVHTVSTE